MDPQNSISPASPNAHNPLLNLPVELLLQIICHWYTLEDVRVYSKNPMPVQYVVKLASTSKDFFQHIYGTGVFWRRITFAQKYQPDRPAFYPRVTDAVVHNMVKNMRQAGSEAPESALTAVHAINLQSTNISAASILELMQSFPNLAVLNVIRCPKVDVFDLRNRFKAWVGCDGASAEVKVSLATMTSPSIKPTTKLESLSLRGVGSGNNKYKHKASTSDESRAKKIFDAVDNILDRIGRILAPNTSFQRKEVSCSFCRWNISFNHLWNTTCDVCSKRNGHACFACMDDRFRECDNCNRYVCKECDGFDETMLDEENMCEHEVEKTNYFSQLRCVNEDCAETYTYLICTDHCLFDKPKPRCVDCGKGACLTCRQSAESNYEKDWIQKGGWVYRCGQCRVFRCERCCGGEREKCRRCRKWVCRWECTWKCGQCRRNTRYYCGDCEEWSGGKCIKCMDVLVKVEPSSSDSESDLESD